MAVTLLGTPLVGIGDNGDQWRVLAPAGLAATPRTRGAPRVVEREVRVRAPRERGASSTSWIARAVREMAVAAGQATLDLRALSGTYLLLLGLMLWRAQRWGVSWPALSLCLIALARPEVLLRLNSFLAVSPTLLALVGVTWWSLRWGRGALYDADLPERAQALAWLFGLCLLGGFTQQAHALFPTMAAAVALLPGLLGPQRQLARRLRAALLLAPLMVGAPLHFAAGSGFRFPEINGFHTVYLGVADVSAHPDRALSVLGLPATRTDLIGRSYFRSPLPPEVRQRVAEIDRFEVAWLYLTEPAASAAMLGRVRRALSDSSPDRGYGTEAGESRWTGAARLVSPPFDAGTPRVWALADARWAFTLPLFLLGAGLFFYRARPAQRTAGLFLLGVALLEAVVAVLGDGSFALRRHLLVASLALDLFIALVAWCGLRRAGALGRRCLERELSRRGKAHRRVRTARPEQLIIAAVALGIAATPVHARIQWWRLRGRALPQLSVVRSRGAMDNTAALIDGVTPPVGSPWDGEGCVRFGADAMVELAASSSVGGIRFLADHNDRFRVECEQAGRWRFAGFVGRVHREGLAWRETTAQFSGCRHLRIKMVDGDGVTSIAEVDPLPP